MGGIVCEGSPWPFVLQQLDDTDAWQDVAYPRTPPCIGITVALLGPGESLTHSFEAPTDLATFQVVYTYRAMDGTSGSAASPSLTVRP